MCHRNLVAVAVEDCDKPSLTSWRTEVRNSCGVVFRACACVLWYLSLADELLWVMTQSSCLGHGLAASRRGVLWFDAAGRDLGRSVTRHSFRLVHLDSFENLWAMCIR